MELADFGLKKMKAYKIGGRSVWRGGPCEKDSRGELGNGALTN